MPKIIDFLTHLWHWPSKIEIPEEKRRVECNGTMHSIRHFDNIHIQHVKCYRVENGYYIICTEEYKPSKMIKECAAYQLIHRFNRACIIYDQYGMSFEYDKRTVPKDSINYYCVPQDYSCAEQIIIDVCNVPISYAKNPVLKHVVHKPVSIAYDSNQRLHKQMRGIFYAHSNIFYEFCDA